MQGLSTLADEKERVKSSFTMEMGDLERVLQFPTKTEEQPSEKRQNKTPTAQTVGEIINKEEIANQGIIKFTEKEISKMSKTFKKQFIANGLCAHITKRDSGRNTYCYEIRYRANGYKIEVSSTDLATAKKKFLEKTMPGEIDKHQVKQKSKERYLCTVFDEWYSFKSKTKVGKKTLETHKLHFVSLPDKIKNTPISKITTANITECLAGRKDRAYEEYRTIFNMLFKYASANGYITHNPMGLIPFIRAERKTREALTENEINAFLWRVLEPKFDKIRQRAYLYYFFGLRASELDKETRREGAFLITRNRKRKNGKIEYKKIPIPKQAESLIQWDNLYAPIRAMTAGKLFKELLGEGKSAYNLRHTFSTVCQQYVRQEIVEIWLGDSPERLVGKVYTHFPDNFMVEQMNAVNFPII